MADANPPASKPAKPITSPATMKSSFTSLLILALAATILGHAQPGSKIEIKDNWYWLNGQKFFIKAIGYEIGARPGQHPYQGVRPDDLDLMAFDLKVIKEGGYNAIRTWSQFSEPQLKLVQDSGLKLIMGIEIHPEQDYGDPAFVRASEDSLRKVLSYAKKYDCIITYLILNEPQTDHLHKVTGQAFVNLMQDLIGIIHQEHPGIPVTISANAMISDFLDENLFDVYAYNCYDHGEAQTATMGFKDFIRGLVELNGAKKPLITTEFGYSVSSRGGDGRYGSNTLTQQRDGLIANYRALLDAGAVGMCPFYYADGWWKGGDAAKHNVEQPEEWFGFWGYSDVHDRFGSPRPVWFALRDYMKALIISPKNTIYTSGKIPLELYTAKAARRVVVKVHDRTIYAQDLPQEGYFADELTLAPDGIEDMELAFEFSDQDGKVIKTESILILASREPFVLPKLSIEVTPDRDLNAATTASIKTTIATQKNFQIAGDLKVSFNPHVGWKVGPQASVPLQDQLGKKNILAENSFPIPDQSWVVNASAGVAVRYGKFVFRIHDQKFLFRGDWAREIARK
jgi:hypothetical protein